MTDFNFDDLELNDKFRDGLNKLFSDENWSQLYETYAMFGKEEAELLFTEQITHIFPELTGKIEGAELPSKELQDFNNFFELTDVRVFFHKKKNMIRLAGNFFMNKKLIAVSNSLFKYGVIELYTFSRNERLQQSELRLIFKEATRK